MDEYYNDDDDEFEFKGIENVQDLFKILTIDEYLASMLKIIYEPTLVKRSTLLNYYRGEDCMTKFCKDLREHATKIINYEKNI